MTSLYIYPLTFNCKKNEIVLEKNSIEWKKQIATVSKKKDLSAIEYLNQKIGTKINNAVVFAYFDYVEDSTIYLMYIPDAIIANFTELYFDSYIPSINMVEIVDGSLNIECLEDKIIIKGKVYGFCLYNETYYFKTINVDQYIEYVQRNNDNYEDVDNDEDDNDDNDEDNDDNDDDDNDDNDNDYNDDDENDDNDDNDDDDDEDEDNNDDDKDENYEGEEERVHSEDEEQGEEGDEDNEDNEEGGSSREPWVASEDEEEDIIEDQNIGEDEEAGIEEDFVDFEPEIEKVEKIKKTKQPKSSQSAINNEDFSIILHILDPEIVDIITPEVQLHPKRQMNIQILKTIKLPIETIQLIEKGIYNYVIEKCNFREIIPIWDNSEFLELYVSKSKHIYSNLNDKTYVNNLKLIEKIKNGSILPYELAFMDTYKLFPERWADIIDEKMKVDKMLKESLQECATDLFECPRCHKNKTIYLQIQLRSSDEPMTNFITCMNCGNKWQFD